MTLLISADAVAWYGAILSTLAILLEIVRLLQDRSKVVVKGKANWRVVGGGKAYPSDKDYVMVTVINKGRRPVTIEKVALVLKGKGNKVQVLADALKKTLLEEGQSVNFLADQSKVDIKTVKRVVAIDATGKVYKGKIKNT